MSSGPNIESTTPNFRNGVPIRLQSWLAVKVKHRFGFGRYETRLVKVNGEVLSLQTSADSLPERFDLTAANIIYNIKTASRTFRIEFERKSYSFQCSSHEEMRHWAHNLEHATYRSFHHNYKLISKLAEGTDSNVYLCSDINDETLVFAVKIIKWLHKRTEFEERIQKERHINSVLLHDHILPAVDIFSTTEADYIVFHYMHGGTLRDMLQRRKQAGRRALPESYARAIMKQLLIALSYIDENNIVHRDIRPDNIFLSDTRFPLIVTVGDFGYADFVSERRVNRDLLEALIGTPPYIATEILRGKKYGPLVDMWSAGVTLYEMLTGDVPFKGKNDHELIKQIKKGKVNFDNWNPDISNEAKSFAQQLLQPDPHKRISPLAALHHRWMTNEFNSRNSIQQSNGSLYQLLPTSPITTQLEDRDSAGNASIDSTKKQNSVQTSLSAMSSSSSISPNETGSGEQSEPSERQTSSLGAQPSLRSMQPTSSSSSIPSIPQPRIQLTNSVREVARDGLSKVYLKKPALMKKLLNSAVVQRQLSISLPKRRQLIVTARAFVAVFRLKALVGGHSATRQLSNMIKADDIEKFIENRKAAFNNDRDAATSLPNPPKRGHVRQRSKGASNVIGKLKLDTKHLEGTSIRSRISLDRKRGQENSTKA